MKIAILNDTHAGIRNSSDVFIDYQERFYSEVFFPYCEENGIDRVLHLGDYYDNRKTVNVRALHRNRKMFLDPLRERGMKMDIIPGNHDVYFKNTIELNSLKEFLGYYKDCVRIYMKPEVVDYDGFPVALLPWVCAENEAECMEFIETAPASVLAGHLELDGFEMMPGVIFSGGMDPALFERYEMVLSGHFHVKASSENIHYLGSQMEFFWSDSGNDKHFHVLDTATGELEAVRNPLTMHEKVYYDDETTGKYGDLSHLENKFVRVIVVNKGSQAEFNRYIDRIQRRDPIDLKVVETHREFIDGEIESSIEAPKDTGEIISECLDMLETKLDKKRIKREIMELMAESHAG